MVGEGREIIKKSVYDYLRGDDVMCDSFDKNGSSEFNGKTHMVQLIRNVLIPLDVRLKVLRESL